MVYGATGQQVVGNRLVRPNAEVLEETDRCGPPSPVEDSMTVHVASP
jgi:hypothetical protein